MKKYILALDQGTTSSRAIIFDQNACAKAVCQKEFGQIFSNDGYVEQLPMDILNSTVESARHVIKKAGIEPSEIAAIGIANQRETVLVWDKITGEPIYNAIVWQCRRTAQFCEKLKKEGLEKRIYAKTGLTLDAYFSASKIRWILDNVKGAYEKAEQGRLLFGTVDTFLMWNLSGGRIHATDYTNASRTMLFNIHELCWDNDLLRIFDIPHNMLPSVFPSMNDYGQCKSEFFGEQLPICGVAGDQQAAMFGQMCWSEGSIKNTYGTGCFLLMNTGDTPIISKRGLITTLLSSGETRPHYALEGSVFMGGAVVKWLRDQLKIIDTAAQSEQLAQSVDDNGGVYFVPAFVGLGAPYWDSYARGLICGLTGGASAAHITRAALESIAYQVFDVVHAMEKDSGSKIKKFSADGGASVNNFLMQFQADILNAQILRCDFIESTALGACYLAGLKAGIFEDINQIKRCREHQKIFKPSMPKDKVRRLLIEWADAVQRARKK